MNNKIQNKRKICVFLSNDLLNKFNSQAQRLGLSKAKILRNWINSTSRNTLRLQEISTNKKNLPFTFFITEEQISKIKQLQQDLNISISMIIRAIIITNCNNNQASPLVEDNNYFYKEFLAGNLINVISRGESRFANMSIKDKFVLANAYIFSGNNDKASEVLNDVNTLNKFDNDVELATYYLVKSRLVRSIGTPTEAIELATKAMIIGRRLKNRGIIGEAYLRIGSGKLGLDLIYEAEDYFDKAIEILDIHNHILPFIQTYFIKAHTCIYNCKFELANYYIHRLNQILTDTFPNNYYRYYLIYIDLLFHYCIGKRVLNIENDYIRNIKELNRNGFNTMSIWFREIYALIFLSYNKRDIAWKLFNEAEFIESQNYSYSYNRLGFPTTMKSFIRVQDNYKDSIEILNQSMQYRRKSNLDFDLYNYLLNTARYLYSNDQNDKQISKTELIKMKSKSKIDQIRKASLMTLSDHRLGLVI